MNGMHIVMNERPFTRLLEAVRDKRRYTYQEMSLRAGGVRSQAWFHKQLNEKELVNSAPVGEDVWAGLAGLLDVSESRIRQAIAEEWLGVVQRQTSTRVASIAHALDMLERGRLRAGLPARGAPPRRGHFRVRFRGHLVMGLGINKDLEPLVRKVRKLGGSVEITGGTHVRWTMPSGEVIMTGLTMRDTTARGCQRKIEAALEGALPRAHAARSGRTMPGSSSSSTSIRARRC